MSEPERYQTIIITFVGGKQVVAMVPAFCRDGDTLMVEKIQVTDAKPMPSDCHFANLEEKP